MNSDSDKRINSRLPNAAFTVLIDAPTHSDILLEPKDISLGGFMVTLHEKPEIGEVIPCSIDVLNQVFDGFKMTVVRVEEDDSDPPSWATGMSLEIPENILADFKLALKEAFPDLERDARSAG